MRGDERRVVEAFARHLPTTAGDVSAEVDFCDLVAERLGERLFVEAKGRTAAIGRTSTRCTGRSCDGCLWPTTSARASPSWSPRGRLRPRFVFPLGCVPRVGVLDEQRERVRSFANLSEYSFAYFAASNQCYDPEKFPRRMLRVLPG